MQKEEFIHSLISLLPDANWNDTTMMNASKNLGLDPHYYLILFKDGISEITDYYDEILDKKMLDVLANQKPLTKIREKIALALIVRLKLDQGKWRFLNPQSVWRTCDIIWQYAGDSTTDLNYYTKRILLTGVYIKAFNYYKKDQSENAKNTELIIQSSLEKIIKIFSIKSKIPKLEDIPILRLF